MGKKWTIEIEDSETFQDKKMIDGKYNLSVSVDVTDLKLPINDSYTFYANDKAVTNLNPIISGHDSKNLLSLIFKSK